MKVLVWRMHSWIFPWSALCKVIPHSVLYSSDTMIGSTGICNSASFHVCMLSFRKQIWMDYWNIVVSPQLWFCFLLFVTHGLLVQNTEIQVIWRSIVTHLTVSFIWHHLLSWPCVLAHQHNKDGSSTVRCFKRQKPHSSKLYYIILLSPTMPDL